ncbi:MAG TPA: MoxR family ATPase [Jatrophihabitans sp.]|jgi:MoxR-like ATPase|uniref:AAA family ATPase n=1 Tax=Jatrophihabitans sp. TaxID=1932789 RepID=UPI002EE491A1
MNFDAAPFRPDTDAVPGKKSYVYHDKRIVLAVNVALATRRPLLITGVPGSGKSTLAADVAERLDWAYVATTVTSRTRLEDLSARFDAVARLSDAQEHKAKDAAHYAVPGVLWWAFNPESAGAMVRAQDHRTKPERSGHGTVVLLDEIDKAEPDLPNDLLEPLERSVINVPGHGAITAQAPLLIIITSNGERSMPPAFLRRCIQLELADTEPGFFTAVATSHFGARQDTLYADIAARTLELGKAATHERRRPPSMAEYLDTVKACLAYGQRPPTADGPGTDLWDAIEEAALRKTRAKPASEHRV